METGEWLDLWNDKILREYIIKICRSETNNEMIRDDLLSEAWLRIGECLAGYTTEYYMHQAAKAVHTAYMREWRYWKRTAKAKEALRKRVQRNSKKLHFYVRK